MVLPVPLLFSLDPVVGLVGVGALVSVPGPDAVLPVAPLDPEHLAPLGTGLGPGALGQGVGGDGHWLQVQLRHVRVNVQGQGPRAVGLNPTRLCKQVLV